MFSPRTLPPDATESIPRKANVSEECTPILSPVSLWLAEKASVETSFCLSFSPSRESNCPYAGDPLPAERANTRINDIKSNEMTSFQMGSDPIKQSCHLLCRHEPIDESLIISSSSPMSLCCTMASCCMAPFSEGPCFRLGVFPFPVNHCSLSKTTRSKVDSSEGNRKSILTPSPSTRIDAGGEVIQYNLYEDENAEAEKSTNKEKQGKLVHQNDQSKNSQQKDDQIGSLDFSHLVSCRTDEIAVLDATHPNAQSVRSAPAKAAKEKQAPKLSSLSPGKFGGSKSTRAEPSVAPFTSSPCRWNRWIVLAIGLLITVNTGSFFFNWPAVQTMMLESEAFRWTCADTTFHLGELHGEPSQRSASSSETSREVPSFPTSQQISVGIDEAPAIQLIKTNNGFVVPRGDGPMKKKPDLRFRLEKENVETSKQTRGTEPQLVINHSNLKRMLGLELHYRSYQQRQPCMKQIQLINSLMPMGVASWMCFSFAGGIAMDVFGPRFTSISGLILSASGWIVLGFSSELLQLYLVSFLLIGCGIDVVFIGILNTSNLFPGYRGTIVSLFNSARSLAFAIPSVFNLFTSTWEIVSFRNACFVYAGLLAFWSVIVYTVVPSRAYPNLDPCAIPNHSCSPKNTISSTNEYSRDRTCSEKVSQQDLTTEKASLLPVSDHYMYSHVHPKSRAMTESSTILPRLDSSTTIASTESMHHTSEVKSIPTIKKMCDPHELQEKPTSYEASNEVIPAISCNRSIFQSSLSTFKNIYSSFYQGRIRASQTLSLMKSASYYPLVPLAILTVLRGSFFSNSALDQLGPFVKLSTALAPLSFLPAPLFGMIADRVSIHFVFIILNSLGAIQFTLLVLAPTSVQSLGIVTMLNFFATSFFLGQFYCYVTLSFPSEFNGTLVGFTICCAGLCQLVVPTMYNFSSNSHNFSVMNAVCLGFSLFSYVFIFLLWWRPTKSNASSLVIRPIPPPAAVGCLNALPSLTEPRQRLCT